MWEEHEETSKNRHSPGILAGGVGAGLLGGGAGAAASAAPPGGRETARFGSDR